MNRKMRLRIKKLSLPLAGLFSMAYYLSIHIFIKNPAPEISALITALIAISFPSCREILEIILGKAMGFSPSHFQKRYQSSHPIEKNIYKLIAEYIPHLHSLVDIIIKAPLSDEDSQQLLKIIEETIENTAIHSQASRCDVNLFVSADEIKLFLQDDGQGFCIFSLTPQQKGLSKIKRLVQRMGGTHQMETGEGGTAHWIEIPLTI